MAHPTIKAQLVKASILMPYKPKISFFLDKMKSLQKLEPDIVTPLNTEKNSTTKSFRRLQSFKDYSSST